MGRTKKRDRTPTRTAQIQKVAQEAGQDQHPPPSPAKRRPILLLGTVVILVGWYSFLLYVAFFK